MWAKNRANGLPRFFFTSIATIATSVGIAFLLLAAMTFAGDPIDGTHSLAWAVAGFVAMARELASDFVLHGWLTVPVALVGTYLFVRWNRRRLATFKPQ